MTDSNKWNYTRASYLHLVQTQIARQCFNQVYILPLLSRIERSKDCSRTREDISKISQIQILPPTLFHPFFNPIFPTSLQFFLPSREKLSSFYKRLLLTRRTRKRYPFPSRVARNRHGTKTSLSSSRISPLSPIDCVRLRAIVPLYPLASSPRFRPRLPTRVFPDYERLRSSSRTMAGGRGTALYPILKIYARINGNCRFQTPREGNVEIRGGAHLCPVERPSSPRKIARKLEKKNNKDTG